ncbi:hypothetical protein H634G_11632 [Metarhizium anisopliae BRIP 53293]|uniref:Uncharacterized protein n=1 Tax=Metarhizium anisopliae BRIP 53293 TaxID=1291518 RepID=A0A0D9NKY3_METAN|nr:hypothetical protein H634G_11632 [Metarhizium anisopliae BRIP 53293]
MHQPLTREQLIQALERSDDPEAQALINSITRHVIYTGGVSTNTCPDMKNG